MDQVKIEFVPSSTANNGPGYDMLCTGLVNPHLSVTLTRRPNHSGIEIEAKSRYAPPLGRQLGYAGKLALENFLRECGINEGLHLYYEDGKEEGYPVGGLGRSGAEAVGAIVSAAVMYDKKSSRSEIVALSAKGEPGEHKDNVSASTNGRFNIIATSPFSNKPIVDCYDVPVNLGLAIGFSSHQKTMGTAGMRKVLQYPVLASELVYQSGLVSATVAALVSGNTNRVLELIWGDRFHELRRADIGGYGNFDYEQLYGLKRRLYEELGIALIVSGAGPNMAFLCNREQHKSIKAVVEPIAVPWFRERGIEMRIEDKEIAKEGAYDYAQRVYNWG